MNVSAKHIHIAALGLIALFFAWHAAGHAIPIGLAGPQCDGLTQALPKLTFHVAELRAGRFPTWDPLVGAGSPDYPIRSHPLYPTTFLTARLLPPWLALSADFFFAFVMVYFFAFILLRKTGAGALPAAAGSLLLTFGGLNLRYLFYPYFAQTAAWIPLIFVAVEGLFARRSRPAMLALGALAVGMMLLAGMVQYVLYALLFAGAYALLQAFGSDEKKSERIAALALALGFVALGLALGAARWLPLAEQADRLRGGYGDWKAFRGLLISPRALLGSLAPGCYADVPLRLRSASLAFGLVAWSLALSFAFTGRKTRIDWFWLAVLAAGLLSCLDTPVARGLFALLPGFGFFEPTRIWAVAGIALAWLAVRGLQAVGEGQRSTFFAAVGLVALFWLALALGAVSGQVPGFSATPRHLLVPLGAGLAVFAMAAANRWLGWRRTATLLALLLALEVCGRAAASSQRINTREIYCVTPITKLLKEETRPYRLLRIGPRWQWYVGGRLYTQEALKKDGIEDLHAYSSIIDPDLLALVDVFRERTDYGLNPFDTRASIQPFLTDAPLRNGLADLVNGRYVLSLRPLADTPNLVERARHDSLVLYENLRAFPRAFVADGIRYAADREQALALLRGDIDLSREVVLYGENNDVPPGDERPWTEVELVESTPVRRVYEVDSNVRGALVVSELFDRNWRAEVNGYEVEILRADVAFRAVPVVAGRNKVVFSYHPRMLTIGGRVSLAAALLIVLLAGVAALTALARSSKNRADR